MARYQLFSDGSAAVGEYAACACIVEDEARTIVAKLCALLPEMTPLEAEVYGGIIGLDYLSSLNHKLSTSVFWYCDSLTLINDLASHRPDLIRLRKAAQSFELTARHVPGHSGHARNEACDKACRWVRRKGERLIAEYGEGEIGLGKGKLRWRLIDLRREDA